MEHDWTNHRIRQEADHGTERGFGLVTASCVRRCKLSDTETLVFLRLTMIGADVWVQTYSKQLFF
jgi:hypothetical protein